MERILARLALEAAAEPPEDGDVHADPPVKVHKHAERPRNTKVARGGCVARAQDPRAHQHRDVDAGPWGEGRRQGDLVVTRCSRVWSVDERNGVVVGGV